MGAALEDSEQTIRRLIVLTRADAQGLLAALDTVKAAGSSSAAQQQVAAAKAFEQLKNRGWPTRAAHLAQAVGGIGVRVSSDSRWALAWQIRDAVTDVVSFWPDPTQSQQSAVQTDDAVRPLITGLIANAATLYQYENIRGQLREQMKDLGTGKAVDFKGLFAAEVPDAAARAQVLQQLSNDGQFAGAVDVKSGLVYKLSPRRWQRVLTYLAPLLLFVVAGGVLVGISALHGVFGDGYPRQLWAHANPSGGEALTWHALIGPYLLVAVGAFTHLGVENVKQGQAGVPIIATTDILAWLNLRWVGLSLTYGPIIVTVVGLSVLGIGDAGHDLTLWLAAGFSVDSVAGLLLTRFDTASGAEAAELTKKIQAAQANAS